MILRPWCFPAASVLFAATLLLTAPTVRADVLTTSAVGVSDHGILVSWTYEVYAPNPVDWPIWVGYDVYRSAAAQPRPCEKDVRVNPDIIPRIPFVTQDASFLDLTATPGMMYTYVVRLVDASRRRLPLPPADCVPFPCNPPAFASCPDLSAPIVVGTVTDWSWVGAVQIQGCEEGCWGNFYLENPAADALRPYAGTSQVVSVWGHGLGYTWVSDFDQRLQLDHFELSACGPTPTRRATWGALKTIYR
jgi:hypothetical protein